MVQTCCVVGCNVRTHDRQGNKLEIGLSFHCFPAWKQNQGDHVSDVTKRRRLAWIAAVRRRDIHFSNISHHLKVCSRHFHSGKPSYEMYESHPDWAPTLHLGHSEVPVSNSDRHERRLQRMKDRVGCKRKTKTQYKVKSSATVGVEQLPETNTTEDQDYDHHVMVEAVAQIQNKDLTERRQECKRKKTECELCEQWKLEINRLQEENQELKSKLRKRELNEDFLKNDSEKVKYYTGLPCFAILLLLFNNVKSFLPAAKKLSHFQMILLTLMRLRLDLPVQHLCHLFNVSHRTLSSAFADTIHVLHTRLGPLVHWPDRHCLQDTKPQHFVESFGKRGAIIVDCFEIRTERPSNVKAQTSSHCKGTHTMKYLIGMTPQGAVSFISKSWGGCASDKHITEKCGLLNKLLPGDVVLSDRGFDVRDAVGMMCAEVQIPSFTNAFCRLEAKDIEDTRATAHLRIHVERVIGRIHKYKLLHSTVPVPLLLPCEKEEMTLLDKIVHVCCILVNMCPSVVVKPGDNETCSC